MADTRQDRLEGILLTLLPVDGSKVPNGQLRPKWVQAAAAAGDTVTEAEFDAIRDRMVTAGLLVKEGLAGQVKMICIGSPYGIQCSSDIQLKFGNPAFVT